MTPATIILIVVLFVVLVLWAIDHPWFPDDAAVA